MSDTPLLSVRGLRADLRAGDAWTRVLHDIDLDVYPGRTTAVLGESGSGKSITASVVMGLLDARRSRIAADRLSYDGSDLLTLPLRSRRRLLGDEMSIVFQDALSALDPVFSVGSQIAEVFRVHRGTSRRSARREAIRLMDRVGIPAAERRYRDYPHQFSGGMRQRVMIAMAIALRPRLLIADEPTTALDVTIQAQIIALLREIQRDDGTALMFISHDLGVVAELADSVAVVYAGRTVERTPADELYAHPWHPYARELLAAAPRLDDHLERLRTIPGSPPAPGASSPGCPFAPRCAWAQEVCHTRLPERRRDELGRDAVCHFTPTELDADALAR